MHVKTLHHLYELAKTKSTKKVAVIAADDNKVVQACLKAKEQGLIAPVLIFTNPKLYKQISRLGTEQTILADTVNKAIESAMQLWVNNEVDTIMKGIVSTQNVIRQILLHRHQLEIKTLLSHLAIFQLGNYHKLIGLSDAAINISPSVDQRVRIIHNSIQALNKLGIKNPKIALLSAIEKKNEKIISTSESLEIKEIFNTNDITCEVEGPVSLDLAISKKAAEIKQYKSKITGNTDLLIVPEIVSGNILYKSFTYLAGANCASVILGAKSPIILTSRADSEQSKLFSITLSVAIS